MVIKKIKKYIIILIASILSSLILGGLINLILNLNQVGLQGINELLLSIVTFIIMLTIYLRLAKRFNNNFSIFVIIVIILSSLTSLGIEQFDSYITNDYLITNTWVNLFGWNKYDSGAKAMVHRVYGFALIIFPSLLIFYSLIVYKFWFKKRI